MDETKAPDMQEELAKHLANLPPEEKKALIQPLLAPALKEAIEEFANALSSFYAHNSPNFAKMAAIAEGAKILQKELEELGVNSFTEGVELFPENVQGAFFEILGLARQHLDTGLLLKDYAEAINPDATVKENFLFKGELEQTLQNAAEDIADYLETLEEEKKATSRVEKLEEAREIRLKAQEAGAIMTLNNHLATFSPDDLADAFTVKCIFYVDAIGKDAGLFDEFGQLQEQARVEFKELVQIHTPFLMFFCTALKKKLLDEEGKRIQVNGKDSSVKLFLPEMAKQLGLDPRKYSTLREGKEDIKKLRLQMFKDKILPFEKFIGVLPNGSNYRVLLYKGYDSETDSIIIESPYIYKLFEIENNKAYSMSLNELFHSNIATESDTGVELAAAILSGLKRRGLYTKPLDAPLTKRTTKTKGKVIVEEFKQPKQIPQETERKEKKVVWEANWENLILEHCPQLTAKLRDVMNSDKKNKAMYFNKIIADAVKVAYKIIMEKSDAPLYYKDLTFSPCYTNGEIIAPTKSKLKTAKLTITHKGKNPNFV